MFFSGTFLIECGAAAYGAAARCGLVLAEQVTPAVRNVLVLSGAAVGIGLGLVGVAYAIHKAWMRRVETKNGHEDFTLAELRELKEKGLLSVEEYNRIKGRVVDSLSLKEAGESGGHAGEGGGHGGSG